MNTLLQNPFDQPNGRPLKTSDYAKAVADNPSLQPSFNLLGVNSGVSEISGERVRFYGYGGNPVLAGQPDFSLYDERQYNYGVGSLKDQYPYIPKSK